MAKTDKESFNRFFWKTFSSINESICSQIKMNHANGNVNPYIKEIVGTTEAILGKGCIEAVAVFGSASYDKLTQLSDIDLLIVVSPTINDKEIEKIKPILASIEIKHNFNHRDSSLIGKITQNINRTTGMFCSHFICNLKEWNERDFSKIFNVNPFLERILAPDKIVLDSMRAGAQILYGELDLTRLPNPYSKIQLVKSLIMCLLLGSGSIFLLPMNSKYMKYELEAYKWALRSSCFYLFKISTPLNHIVACLSRTDHFDHYLSHFMSLRKNPRLDIRFALKVPWQILKIHLFTLKYH